jgi:DNA invertase Pin-like site-specific DNA recombinase
VASQTFLIGYTLVALVERENETGNPDTAPHLRAAQYVRMSTEHQQYSVHNQTEAIAHYAAQRGFEIVRTYADQGCSGLSVTGRPALQQLLADVGSGCFDYEALFVYDVSRLGRFQDPDEAASYELRCRRAGIAVHYCAEQFENDGSIGASIIKTVKRVMAGEYSRELSVKVFAGQANLVRLGFRQGGTPGYGLRRILVDQHGRIKGELSVGEAKNITTDRVILGHGPAREVDIVRDIFRMFAEDRRNEREIADLLNARAHPAALGRPWKRNRIYRVLTNENYIGNSVWARYAVKLGQRRVANPPSDWVRSDGTHEPIVSRATFERAQAIIAERAELLDDEDMLEVLRAIRSEHGMLSYFLIQDHPDAPAISTYQRRFGSLLRAYKLVGFTPSRDFRYLAINRALRERHRSTVSQVVDGIEAAGGLVEQDPASGLLTINREVTAAVVIARCTATLAGSLRWTFRFDTLPRPDLTIAVRMDEGNLYPRDYYLLPRLDLRAAALRLAEFNGLSLDAYRVDSLDALFAMARRRSWPVAA